VRVLIQITTEGLGVPEHRIGWKSPLELTSVSQVAMGKRGVLPCSVQAVGT
jgi:hypothetical protein